MTEWTEPSERQFQRLFGHVNVAPPLAEDVETEPYLVLIGVFDRDGELRGTALRTQAEGMPTCPGVVVPVLSHTDTVAELRARWRRAVQA